jgi:hypothetical protein
MSGAREGAQHGVRHWSRARHFRPLQSGALSSSGAAQMKAVVAEARFHVGEVA